MKYVITGAAGHTAKPIVENLLAAGHEVKVISRNADHVKDLVTKGATVAEGSVEDANFLAATFKNADAVYTMVPPNFQPEGWKKWIGQIGANFAKAIEKAGIKYVVNLSSIGAHMPDGCGPVSGLHQVENELNKLEKVHVKHLRAGYFYNNFFGNMDMIRHLHILGSNFNAETAIPMAAPEDIAAVATEELLHLDFSGHSIRYVISDERKAGEIAKVLGTAIGEPALPWVEFTDEQLLDGLKQAGLTEEVAANYVEMNTAMRSGEMTSDYHQDNKDKKGNTKLEAFAKAFAAVYHSK